VQVAPTETPGTGPFELSRTLEGCHSSLPRRANVSRTEASPTGPPGCSHAVKQVRGRRGRAKPVDNDTPPTSSPIPLPYRRAIDSRAEPTPSRHAFTPARPAFPKRPGRAAMTLTGRARRADRNSRYRQVLPRPLKGCHARRQGDCGPARRGAGRDGLRGLTPPADATKQERARAVAARARLSLGELGRRAGLPDGGDGVHAICWAVPVCGRRARESGRGEMARSPPHRFRYAFGGGRSNGAHKSRTRHRTSAVRHSQVRNRSLTGRSSSASERPAAFRTRIVRPESSTTIAATATHIIATVSCRGY